MQTNYIHVLPTKNQRKKLDKLNAVPILVGKYMCFYASALSTLGARYTIRQYANHRLVATWSIRSLKHRIA